MATHVHKWRMMSHIDGCHYYSSGYTCECGAVRNMSFERNVKEDPYSMVWMIPDEGVTCKRCQELLDGAEPNQVDMVAEATDGTK